MSAVPMIKGWAVVDTIEGSGFIVRFFLDLNNAFAFAKQQKNCASLVIKPQYMHPEWAEDIYKSRPRHAEKG